MGGTSWSDEHYSQRAQLRAAQGVDTFAYSKATSAAPKDQQKAHPSLEPNGVKMRESRDSAEHPESNAVIVLFDVTGSMGEVPKTIQKKLPSLMGLLLRKAYLTDPAIMIGAIGDAYTDRVPLQIGQFESGIEIENDLTNLYLEGNGGGQVHESYELGMYFAARHTVMDCFEKRQKKGYLFIIGDEQPYDVSRSQVKTIIGDDIESDIPVRQILAELQERYNVFFILPRMTHYWDDSRVNSKWRELLGERFLKIEDPESVCELIAATIGLCESTVDHDGIKQDLGGHGLSTRSVAAVTTALAKVASNSNAVAKVPVGSGLATV
jgi:hypothetical protein